jgi:replicative superfamily II helicase
MIGRAGRPQYDTHAVACILVHEPKKNFFKKFLYDPFPVESQLAGKLQNHLNAEIAGGAIGSRCEYISYTTTIYYGYMYSTMYIYICIVDSCYCFIRVLKHVLRSSTASFRRGVLRLACRPCTTLWCSVLMLV